MTPEEVALIAKLQDRLKASGRGCGGCQACCTIMAVDMAPLPALSKPERVRCGHLCNAGCKIYDAKPDSCTAFMCLWLATELFDPRMPPEWRPDRVGAVVDLNDVGTMTVHLKHEERWRKQGPLRDMLLYLAGGSSIYGGPPYVILDRPSGSHLLFRSNGSTEELIPCGLSPTGNKQFHTRLPGEA